MIQIHTIFVIEFWLFMPIFTSILTEIDLEHLNEDAASIYMKLAILESDLHLDWMSYICEGSTKENLLKSLKDYGFNQVEENCEKAGRSCSGSRFLTVKCVRIVTDKKTVQ